MKKGDKLRCKIDNMPFKNRYKLHNISLRYYTIKRVWYEPNYSCYWVEFEECELHFSVIKLLGKNYLGDYFNTNQEIRKMKFKQLFETNI